MVKSEKILPFWLKDDYYKLSQEGSEETSHPGMQLLKKSAASARSVLDLGCGEGTRLNWLVGQREVKALGVDISPRAVETASKKYPELTFIQDDAENTKVRGTFDLVYSAFVLEHLTKPQKFVDQVIKFTRKEGVIILIAPNFGAPNRRSPNSTEDKFNKLFEGFKNDFRGSSDNTGVLDWKAVVPRRKEYIEVDDDTLSEPYLKTLLLYMKNKGLHVFYYSSLWELEPWSMNPRKSLFKLLGLLGIYPFKFWGPQFIVAARK